MNEALTPKQRVGLVSVLLAIVLAIVIKAGIDSERKPAEKEPTKAPAAKATK